MEFLLLPLAVVGGVTILLVVVLLQGMIIMRLMEKRMFVNYNSILTSTPPIVFNLVLKLYWVLDALPNYLLPPPQRTIDVVMSFVRSQVVMTLVELGVFDAIKAKGPASAAQLSEQLGTNIELLDRLMRTATCMRFLVARPIQRKGNITQGVSEGGGSANGRPVTEMMYSLTGLSAVLCEQHPNSIKDFALTMRDQYHAYDSLVDCVKSGKPAFDLKAGQSWWQQLEKNPFLAKRFDAAMVASSNLINSEALALDYSWDGYEQVVDVGGGTGGCLVPLLTHCKHLQATLFDLPQVIKNAEEVWSSKYPDLKRRLTLASGSFLDAITPDSPTPIPAPTVPTVYILRSVLHDWNDDDCVQILSHIRSAIGSENHKAVVAVAEASLLKSDYELETPKRLSDVHMMAMCGGKERNEDEYEGLFKRAGFKLRRIVKTRGIFAVVEAVPV